MYDPRVIAWEQHARKARTAMSILDTGAWIGLLAGCLFWNTFFWTMIAPVGPMEMALSLAMSAGYSVVLPMLISLLAPSTPAGMALAETRWRTFGHALSVAAALFMSYHAFTVLWAWWLSRPATARTGQDLFLAIGTMIVFVVVPALAWVQIAPDRWVAEIAQAQQVRRLKAAQQANLMAAQLQYARAMALLKRGLANTTANERAELAGTLIAMQRAENEAISQVADGMRLLTGIDTQVPLLDDPQLLGHYEQLTTQLDRLIAPISDADYAQYNDPPLAALRDVSVRSGEVAAAAAAEIGNRERNLEHEYAERRARYQASHPDYVNASPAGARAGACDAALISSPAEPPVARPNAETGGSAGDVEGSTVARDGPSRAVAVGPLLSGRWRDVARRSLSGAWKRSDLQRALSIEKTQANDLIREWKQQGFLLDVTSPAYHYTWKDN